MLSPSSLPLPEELAPWHEFYSLLGAASATLIGLLFVAASVGAPAFNPNRRAPTRMFLSASVVHFGGTLAVSLIVLAPISDWRSLGLMVLGCGLFGMGYYGLTWRDTVQDGLHASLEWDDSCWYAVLPAVGYLLETASGVMLCERSHWGCVGLAVSAGVLLVVGIHNAWDITLWSLTRRRPRPETSRPEK